MGKKVGIMSMQRIKNFGSFLQAYGLKSTLEKLEYNVEFVDYVYEEGFSKTEKYKKGFNKENLNIKNFFEYIRRKIFYYKSKINHERCLKKIGINSKKNIHPQLDSLVIGSDEVFNCIQGYPVGYSRELFGKNYENINVISYAGSFGYTKLEDLKKYKIDNELANYFSKMTKVSVRDENSESIVESLINKKPLIHLDPVLISDFTNMIDGNVKYNNYIILYAYPNRLTEYEEKYIKEFAHKNRKKVLSVGFYQRIADLNLVVTPFELLKYFKYADFVITDTFHGTIFSLKMNTKFCTIIRDSNRNKLFYLLEKLKQKDRIVNSIEDIDKLYKIDIDFSQTNKIILDETEKSLKYLKDSIG